MNNRKLGKFLLWTFVIGWILQAAASYFAYKGVTLVYTALLSLAMFAPFLGVLLAGIPLRGMGWKPRIGGNVRWILLAWFGPAVLGVLGTALYFFIFPDRLDLSGAYLAELGGEAVLDQLSAQGITFPIYAALQFLLAITFAPWLNMLFAVGEEVGWRGVLQPGLTERFGKTKGRIWGGIIWGIWHWPIMLLAGYEYGSEYFGAPVLGLTFFCLITVGMGTLLDVVYTKGKSIWIPALAHGAINAFAGVPLLLLDPEYADQMILGPSVVGAIGGLPMLLLAVWILMRYRRSDTTKDDITMER